MAEETTTFEGVTQSMSRLSRRDLLVGGGSLVVGAAAGGSVVASWPAKTAASSAERVPITVADWTARRKPPYYIAHRGAGDVVPEHTLPGYRQALSWGAECIEISVVMSSDRVLYCLHDVTLDRTTTLKGPVRTRTSTQLDTARVSIPRLGPRWSGPNQPAVPRLADVLKEVGGRAVLCIEPKDDAAYPSLVEMIASMKLESSVMIKLDASSPRIAAAKKAGYPVFAYLGNPTTANETAVVQLARRLDPRRDVLVLPARRGLDLMPASLFETAASTGVPIWVFPVHRRQEAKYFSLLGVEGIITPSLGYVANTVAPMRTDVWSSGGLTPGELTRDPYSAAFRLSWLEESVIAIPTPGRQAFVTFGQFAPITAGSYRISFDASFDPLPKDTWQHVSIAFGHADDRYYEHRLGDSDGYHALLRADGTMGVFSHVEGDRAGQGLVPSRMSSQMKAGAWARMTLDVSPDGLQWSRDDGTVLQVADKRFRGGYFHIGSSATDGAIKLRGLSVS